MTKPDGRSAEAAWLGLADWFWHRLDGVGDFDAVAGVWVGHRYAPCVRELVDFAVHWDSAGDQDGSFFCVAAFGELLNPILWWQKLGEGSVLDLLFVAVSIGDERLEPCLLYTSDAADDIL